MSATTTCVPLTRPPEFDPIDSAIGYFAIGESAIEVTLLWCSRYSSAIGMFVIGHSPVGLQYVETAGRRVVFQLPPQPDRSQLMPPNSNFQLPIPEGWAS